MMEQRTIAEQADQYYDNWNPEAKGSFGAYVIQAERARVRRLDKDKERP